MKALLFILAASASAADAVPAGLAAPAMPGKNVPAIKVNTLG